MSWNENSSFTHDSDTESTASSYSSDSDIEKSDLNLNDVASDDVVDCVSAGKATNPRMTLEIKRLDTFVTWPISDIINPQLLARDGFFYLGVADKVKCAFCNGVLCLWVKGDYPNVEHDKHFPNCPFVRGQNVNNVPIAADPRRIADQSQNSNRIENLRRVTANSSAANKKKFNIEEREIAARLDSNQVKAIMKMGYEQRLVHDVIKHQLECNGTDFESMALLAQALDDAKRQSTAHSTPHVPPVLNVPAAAASKSMLDEKKQSTEVRKKKKSKRRSEVEKTKESCTSNETSITVSRVDQHIASQVESTKIQSLNRKVDLATSPNISREGPSEASLSDRCHWCVTGEANTAFIPCGHTMCSQCSKSLGNCPICGRVIEQHLRIYLS